MTTEDYESRTDSVLAWKKAQKLGRFDPNAPEIEKSKIEASFKEVEDRGAWWNVECDSKAIFQLSNKKGILRVITRSQLTPIINRHQAGPPLPCPPVKRPPPRSRLLRW